MCASKSEKERERCGVEVNEEEEKLYLQGSSSYHVCGVYRVVAYMCFSSTCFFFFNFASLSLFFWLNVRALFSHLQFFFAEKYIKTFRVKKIVGKDEKIMIQTFFNNLNFL